MWHDACESEVQFAKAAAAVTSFFKWSMWESLNEKIVWIKFCYQRQCFPNVMWQAFDDFQ